MGKYVGDVMQIRLLGQVDVLGAHGEIDVGGPRQRRLLGALAAHPNTVVSTDRLVEIVWEDDPPDTARRVFRTYVNRLRRGLEEAEDGLDGNKVVVTRSPGYMLVVGDEQLDVLQAQQLVAEARRRRSVDPDVSSRLLADALSLWRGQPFGEFAAEDWAAPEAARLEELQVAVAEEWCAVRLELEDPIEVIPDLRRWIGDHPLREGLRALEMNALNQVGRQADALRAYQEYRETLADTGLDPSQRLIDLERAIATRDPSVEAKAAGRRVRDYRLVAKIGSGAFGDIYRGTQPSLDRTVAVKVIRPELADDPEFVRRFEAEAHLVAQLEHPRIVPLYDFWREPGAAYLVMRWLRGGTVADQVRSGPLTEATALRLVEHVGDALRASHRAGVVHGDVKPANILVDDEGGFYLGDFGVAGLIDAESGPLDFSADIAGLARTVHAAIEGNAKVLSERVAAVLDHPGQFDKIEQLVAAFQVAVAEAEPPRHREPAAFLVNPYVGLRPFDEGDASMFFGRDELVDRLLTRVADSRWMTLVGPSGSGKSSVVRAGLLPALRSGQIPGSDRWFLTTMVPGPKPFQELETALLRVAVNPPVSLLSQLTEDDSGIARAVSRVLPDRDGQLTLVLDQFEELFTLVDDDERERFLTALAVAVSDERSQLRVISTLRADFYDRPLRSRAIADLVRDGTEVITPMTAEQIETAIVRPAEASGAIFEGALAGRIAADVTDQPAALPLLQYALSEVFERNRSGMLTAAAYDEVGGVQGALTTQADGVLAGLGQSGRDAAKRLFARLVTLGEGVEDTRRRVRLADLPDDETARDAIEAFAGARLLTYDRDPASRAPTVEVAHEALIREWQTLRAWLDDDRDGLRLLRHLGDSAAAWGSSGRDHGELYRGARLSGATDWVAAHPGQLTAIETEFVDASNASAEADREAEERRVRRLRRLVGAVGAALVVALVAGGLALRAQQRADDEATRAEASAADALAQTDVADEQRQLAEESAFEALAQSDVADEQRQLAEQSAVEALAQTERAEQATLISRSAAAVRDDPELAVLLALEANERAPGDDTRRALLGALGGAGVANKVLSRQPLGGDCFVGGSSFYTMTANGVTGTDGPVQLSVLDGVAVARDVVSGEVFSFGPPVAPCALGARNDDIGAAGNIEGRLWVGPNWEVSLDVGGSILGATNDRAIVLAFTSPQDEEGEISFYDASGQLVGQPIPAVFTAGEAMNRDGSLFAVSVGIEAGRNPNGFLYVFDTETGTPIVELEAPIASTLGFDPTSGNLIAGLADGTVATFDPLTGVRRTRVSTAETFGYVAAGARADGTLIMVSQGAIELIDPVTGPVGSPFPLQNVRQAWVRSDGLVVTTQNDGTADVYDLGGNAVVERAYDVLARGWIATIDGTAAVLQELSPTDRFDETASVELIDLETGTRTQPDLTLPDGSTFPAVAAYPAMDGFWAVSLDHRLARWRDGVFVDELYMGSEPGVRNDFVYPGFRVFGDLSAVVGLRQDGVIEATLIRFDDATGAEVALTVDTGMDESTENYQGTMVHPSAAGGLFVIERLGRITEYGPSGGVIRQAELGSSDPTVITLDPTGARLAVSFNDGGGVAIIDVASGEVEQVPGNSIASTLGFNGDGSVLGISAWSGEVRLYDVGSREVPPIIWDGTGTFGAEPGWYDAATDSLWLPASGQVLEIPLDPARWVEKACAIVDRDLTQEEWDRFVPGNEPLRSVCS